MNLIDIILYPITVGILSFGNIVNIETKLEKRINERETPIEMYSPENIDMNKENAFVILTRGYGNGIMDYNDKERIFEEDVEKIKDKFNTYVALVDCPSDFFESHKLAEEKLGNKFDFLYISAHGSPTSIMLSEKFGISSSDVSTKYSKEYLPQFYNSGAKGIINACLTAYPDFKNNFAQRLSDSIGIPIEAAKVEIQAYLTDDMHLEECWSKIEGFDPENNCGEFYSKNGRRYGIEKINDTYEVFSFNLLYKGDKGKFELPDDFDPLKVWHFDVNIPTRENFRMVYPHQNN